VGPDADVIAIVITPPKPVITIREKMLHCAKKPRGNTGPARDRTKFRVINGTKPRGPGRDG
jgi:hypothetical protein